MQKKNAKKRLAVTRSTVRTLAAGNLLHIDEDLLGQVHGGWSGGGSETWGAGPNRTCNG